MNGKKPKYQKLIEYLKKTIIDSELKSGDKIPSENALSAKFNISRHTVRKALGELVNEGWLITIRKGNFCPGYKNKQWKWAPDYRHYDDIPQRLYIPVDNQRN